MRALVFSRSSNLGFYMSSDNYLYIDGEYEVFHCSASPETEPNQQGDPIGKGQNLADALRIAEDFGYTEYGIEVSDDAFGILS